MKSTKVKIIFFTLKFLEFIVAPALVIYVEYWLWHLSKYITNNIDVHVTTLEMILWDVVVFHMAAPLCLFAVWMMSTYIYLWFRDKSLDWFRSVLDKNWKWAERFAGEPKDNMEAVEAEIDKMSENLKKKSDKPKNRKVTNTP